MPSGRTHDAVTMLLTFPLFCLGYWYTSSLITSAIFTAACIFGGVMFGPDLDTRSKQYSRWGFFRIIWLPYRVVFSHRSRLSHGIILSTFIRVLYFSGFLLLLIGLGVYLRAVLFSGLWPSADEFFTAFTSLNSYISSHLAKHVWQAAFAGLWVGAAIHTFTDVLISVVRKASQIF
jgi:uncharacterized metal-binding protein